MAEEIDAAEAEAAIGEPLDSSDRATLHILAELLKPIVYQAAEQTNSMGRWLLASLLAVNGGAIVATLSSVEITKITKIVAGGFWLGGLLLAIVSGFVGLQGGRRGVAIASSMISAIILGLHADKFPDLRFKNEQAELNRWSARTIKIGLGSLAAFTIGAAIIAWELAH